MQVVFRVDASTQIGTGHVMRCLALAQAWHDTQGQPIFVMTTSVPALEERLKSEGMQVVHLTTEPGSLDDAEQTTTLAHQFGATWVVVDGYHFGGEYQQILKQSKLHLLFIDDYGHAEHYYADFVLNQNISADEQWYNNREAYTQLLLDTRYALLRREFWQWQGWQRTVPPVAKKVLVSLGGADPDNITLKVIQSLQIVEVEELEAVVVVGGSNPHYENLKRAVQDSRYPIQLQQNVTNMPELMAWADVAISAGGTTCWELAFMGLASILLILAENQRAIAEKLATLNLAVNLGWHQDVKEQEIASTLSQILQSPEQRSKMIKVSQQIVDGEGSSKIVRNLEANSIQLRPVIEDDCEILWHWANDPVIRSVSFSSEYISWSDHVQWFASKLGDQNCVFYIALNPDNVPIGQVRYEITDKEATISLALAESFRGQGYGGNLILLGCKKLGQNSGIEIINAYIKPNNLASIRAFLKSGFREVGKKIVYDQQALHLIKNL
ncbi:MULTISPECIES: UDP-2,4-diacetamido-2,4,6-trideoxy-beta-L-altropyranose hydrolase [Planktothrix]|uniref:N-Acetylneuraminate cytidylyltransferase n=1 Tax=Planktothrix rubescens CCAP 1459/22 TaxID=329571 RepID=A0A6J7ZSU1_PLARU|nr:MULTISPECIES: UDP-2,4-diacetamido-2,4,6-trideoxy-beta-L-altropyranose hydrolase [Planktothrix]CAC5345711.1 N-Acetylneuraminate cytidylyltransferase [Planktothrix rubescens NIVA-CYA 18]CAD5954733.1 GCN5-related N-acetyltransferase [Planktothrix rubescens NIVA-CYA 18]